MRNNLVLAVLHAIRVQAAAPTSHPHQAAFKVLVMCSCGDCKYIALLKHCLLECAVRIICKGFSAGWQFWKSAVCIGF